MSQASLFVQLRPFFLSRAFLSRLTPFCRDSRLFVATCAFLLRLAPFCRDSRLLVATGKARQYGWRFVAKFSNIYLYSTYICIYICILYAISTLNIYMQATLYVFCGAAEWRNDGMAERRNDGTTGVANLRSNSYHM